MNADQSASNRNLWIALGALLIGLVIGLVILGWWLFPVRWTDASPEDLLADYQVDYLRAAIDSFALTFDSNAALVRYQELGEDGPSTLATVQADPGASPTAVAAYSQLVAAGQEQGFVEEPAQEGMSNVAKFLIALVVILLFAGLVVWLLSRGRGQAPVREAPAAAPGQAPAVAESPAAVVEEPVVSEVAAEELSAEGEVAEGEVAEGDTHPVQVSGGSPQPAEEPPPLWLAEEAAGEGGPGLGAAGLAAAGLVGAAAAASGDEEEAAQSAELAASQAITEPTSMEAAPGEDTVQTLLEGASPEGASGSALGAAALGTAAYAAGLDETGQPTEPVTIEELAGVEPGPPVEAAPMTAEELFPEEPGATEPTAAGAAVYQPAQMDYGLAYIEGIGPVFAEKLAAIGITTPGELLDQGATPRGRQDIAEKTGISGRLILEWVNHVDLFRLKGVGSEYADLLEAAGVDTVIELAMRNPENLFQALLSVNESKHLVRKLPTQAQVQDWVEQAKSLPRKIYY